MTITGVPEHFNYPFIIHQQSQELFDWKVSEGGSGQMIERLESGEVDMAIMLSEAAYKLTSKNSSFFIAGTYISTPLRWGVFSDSSNAIEFSDENILNKTFGISRFNSGSHLMTLYEVYKRNLDPSKVSFKVVGSLQGAKEAFEKKEIDLFLWEEQMCRPYIISGHWKQVGLVQGSWPAFVFVLKKEQALIQLFEKLKDWLSFQTQSLNHQFEKYSPSIGDYFELDPQELLEWKDKVHWSEDFVFDQKAFKSLIEFMTWYLKE